MGTWVSAVLLSHLEKSYSASHSKGQKYSQIFFLPHTIPVIQVIQFCTINTSNCHLFYSLSSSFYFMIPKILPASPFLPFVPLNYNSPRHPSSESIFIHYSYSKHSVAPPKPMKFGTQTSLHLVPTYHADSFTCLCLQWNHSIKSCSLPLPPMVSFSIIWYRSKPELFFTFSKMRPLILSLRPLPCYAKSI